jgi:hypothetical protein
VLPCGIAGVSSAIGIGKVQANLRDFSQKKYLEVTTAIADRQDTHTEEDEANKTTTTS